MSKSAVVWATAPLLGAFLGLHACGSGVKTNDGNGGKDSATPGEPGPGSGTGGGGQGLARLLPVVDFSLALSDPTADANGTDNGAALTDTGTGNDALEVWAVRLDGQIRRANNLLALLDQAGVRKVGSFVKRGSDATLGATLKTLDASAAPYAYDAVICRKDKPLTHVQWAADGTATKVVRYFAAGDGPVAATLITSVTAQKNADGTATVDFTADGPVAGTPWTAHQTEEGAGPAVTESIHGVRTADGAVTLRGVQSWHDVTVTAYTPGTYLTGKLLPAKTGAFVAWRSAATLACPGPFDETKPDAPGWCLGRDLGSATRYTDDERAAAWKTLAPIGIQLKATLAPLTQDPTLACPTADAG